MNSKFAILNFIAGLTTAFNLAYAQSQRPVIMPFPINMDNLSLEQGLNDIQKLDHWFSGLSPVRMNQVAQTYALNRNRLYIIAQTKRIEKDIGDLRSDPQKQALIEQKQANLDVFRKVKEALLDDTKILSSKLIENLKDINSLYKDKMGVDLGMSESYSKTSGGELFARSFSKTSNSGFGEAEALERLLLSSESYGNADQDVEIREILKKIRSRRPVRPRRYKPLQFVKQNIIDTSKAVACHEPKDAVTAPDYFDPHKHPQESKFLNDLGIKGWTEKAKERNLSHWFGEPTSQFDKSGDRDATCVGHVIAADMASVINSKNNATSNPVTLSTSQIYGVANQLQHEPQKRYDWKGKAYCETSSYHVNTLEGIHSITSTLDKLKENPACANSASPKILPDLYSVGKYSSLEYPELGPERTQVGYDFFRILIDNGKPPMVTVDSDARQPAEDWFEILPRKDLNHILNIVGYGEDIEPQSLCKTKFFWVRDSLAKGQSYHKIAASNLLEHILGVYKITEVREVRKAQTAANTGSGLSNVLQGFFQRKTDR